MKNLPQNEVARLFMINRPIGETITGKLEVIDMDREMVKDAAYELFNYFEGVEIELFNEDQEEHHRVVLLDKKRPKGWYKNYKNRMNTYTEINEKLGRLFKDLRTWEVNHAFRDQVAFPSGTYAPAETLMLNAATYLLTQPKNEGAARACLMESMRLEIQMIDIMCKATKQAIDITASIRDVVDNKLYNKLAIGEAKHILDLVHVYGLAVTQCVTPTKYDKATDEELLGAMCEMFIKAKPWYTVDILAKKERIDFKDLYQKGLSLVSKISFSYPTEEANRFAGKDLTMLRQNMINYKAIIEGKYSKEEKVTALVMFMVSMFGMYKGDGSVMKHWYEF